MQERGKLHDSVYAELDALLAESDARVRRQYPGPRPDRQPVHTVYVPAGQFTVDLPARWGEQAGSLLASRGQLLGVDEDVRERVARKLRTEPIEDLRIDFEDGYGWPGDQREDADARQTAVALAEALRAPRAPAFAGIRVKSLERASRHRGIRTLDVFLNALLDELPTVPTGFVVTCPKVTAVEQVSAMTRLLAELERAHHLDAGVLRFEVQIETAQSVLGVDGTVSLPRILTAAGGRCAGLHFGAGDYIGALGISGEHQRPDQPAADVAKALMQLSVAGTPVRLSDGSTNQLPVGPAIAEGWREHLRLVRRSLQHGFYQGWDLHPHQLPSRFAATYAFFREGMPAAARRLRYYTRGGGGTVLDEPAIARALAGYLVRGLDCGAIDEGELDVPGVRELAAGPAAR